MKLILIFILSLLSISLFSLDTETLLQYSTPINLNQGIETHKVYQNINDFTYIPENTQVYSKPIFKDNKEDIIPFNSNSFYFEDFSEDPFDGRIEPYVIGEPLPSINLSFFIASLISILFLQYNKKNSTPKSISEKIS